VTSLLRRLIRSAPMRIGTQMGLPFLALMIGVLLAAPRTISFVEPRPLYQLGLRLEEEYNWRITYEDPAWESSDDLVSASPGRAGFITPRPTPLTVTFAEPNDTSSISEKREVLESLVQRAHLPATMAMVVLHNGDYSHVVPVALKQKGGKIVAFVPMLDSRISFASGQRTLFEAVGLVLSQVSNSRGIHVAMGTIPNNLFLGRQQLTFAENETARDVLMRFFEDASGTSLLAGGPAIRVTWALLYDANAKQYFFNAHVLPPGSGANKFFSGRP